MLTEDPTPTAREPARPRALDGLSAAWPRLDGVVYLAFAAACVSYAATLFYAYLRSQTGGQWSAPLDDVFIHFDYARATARGYPFQWSEGNGYSSGNTSLTYPFVLALGYLVGFRELDLMLWAALVACASVVVFLVAAGRLLEPLGRWAKYLVPPAVLSLGALDWSLFSGMENAFHLGVFGAALLVLLSLLRPSSTARRARRLGWLTGLAGALLVATRPESVVSVAAFALLGGHVLARRLGRRSGLTTVVRVALPGVILLVVQAVANRILTGEWSANGAIAKLTINNPYMTAGEKWDEYLSLLKYVVVRNTQHHFSDAEPWGWLVPAAAAIPLFVRSLRPAALLLWAQIAGWLCLVAMNGQVRWQNERYTMAAVAWLLVLAAMGIAALASRAGERLPGRLFWAVRAGVAGALVAFYWHHQAPNMRDQIWFFGRASRNIRDQHVVAGTFLARSDARRVLVGDAGALLYMSDRPGLDLIGLGGYHDYPFARAGVHGLGAALELIEHMPEGDRPDAMAIYPTWWGDLPAIFGRPVRGFPVAGNVICGGAEKVVYAADWSAFDGSGTPWTRRPGEQVIDELDVADLLSERAHDYVFPRPGGGYVGYRVLPYPADPGRDLFDAGRLIPGGRREAARMESPPGPFRLILRTTPAHAATVEVSVNGRVAGQIEVPAARGWSEVSLDLPEVPGPTFELALTPVAGELWDDHVWLVATEGPALKRR